MVLLKNCVFERDIQTYIFVSYFYLSVRHILKVDIHYKFITFISK